MDDLITHTRKDWIMKIKSLTQVLLSAFLVRLLVTGASIGDALALISLSGLYAFWCYLEFKKEPEANKEIKNKLFELEEKVRTTENKIGAFSLSSQLRR